MPSPFPGMDPWLEAPGVFPDFHTRFLGVISAQLNAVLPPPFYSALSTRVYLSESTRTVEPDVDVLVPKNTPIGTQPIHINQTSAALLELPYTAWPDEDVEETFLEIFSSKGDQKLITCLELLSPANKTPGRNGRGLYLAKQRELTNAKVNFLELDFLRAGVPTTLATLTDLRKQADQFDYHVSIFRYTRAGFVTVAPIAMDKPLPSIPIPLTPDVSDVIFDLQTAFNRTYEEGVFSRRISYAQPPEPPLTPAQKEWANRILSAKNP